MRKAHPLGAPVSRMAASPNLPPSFETKSSRQVPTGFLLSVSACVNNSLLRNKDFELSFERDRRQLSVSSSSRDGDTPCVKQRKWFWAQPLLPPQHAPFHISDCRARSGPIAIASASRCRNWRHTRSSST